MCIIVITEFVKRFSENISRISNIIIVSGEYFVIYFVFYFKIFRQFIKSHLEIYKTIVIVEANTKNKLKLEIYCY